MLKLHPYIDVLIHNIENIFYTDRYTSLQLKFSPGETGGTDMGIWTNNEDE